MARPLWIVKLIRKGFPHLRAIARLTKAPGLDRAVDYGLFGGDDLTYLPRDRVIPVGRTVPGQEEVVLPSQVVEHFIRAAGYHWLMNTCICRESLQCKNHPIDLGCLFLGEAALGINPKLGRRVSRDEALEHARKCREAGLVHVIGRNKLDSVWLGVSPGRKLLTICNCCSCCCIWRAIPYLSPRITAKVSRMPGLRLQVTDECQGCGTCMENVCFVNAITLEGGRAVIGDQCKGCGRCAEKCPHQAIEVTLENEGFVAETIARIKPLVDVS